MQDQPGQQQGQHAADDAGRRVPCPYDPKHTCDRDRMKRHLARCPARMTAESAVEYRCKNVNVPNEEQLRWEGVLPDINDQEVALSVSSASDERLLEVISIIDREAERKGIDEGLIITRILNHPALAEALDVPGLGAPGKKHLLQNASLLGHLQMAGLLQGEGAAYVEFGSGRGQLTFWLAKALNERAAESTFVLVDRASHRHKFDNKLREDEDLSVHRVRADIQDLVLAKTPGVENSLKPLVGVSKHLCGGATDLALRCLANSGLSSLNGLMIALCCHHRCGYDLFAGKEFLRRCGLGGRAVFGLLCGLTSWATCGTGRPRSAKEKDSKSERIVY